MNGCLWLVWVVANAVGGAVGGAAVNAFGLLGLAVSGIPIGLAQYLTLRLYWQVRWTWVLATAFGMLIGWVLLLPSHIIVALVFDILSFLFSLLRLDWGLLGWLVVGSGAGAISGLVCGLTQKVLTGFPFSPASPSKLWEGLSAAAGMMAFWIAGTTLVWRVLLMGGIGSYMSPLQYFLPPMSGVIPDSTYGPTFVVIAGALFGAIYGAITGIALARQERQAGAFAR